MKRCFALLVFASFFPAIGNAEVVITNDSEWRYLHPSDGIDPAANDKDFHSTFMKADFDDSAWKTGKDKPGPHGGFGYGDADFAGVDLVQPENLENRKAGYFRIKFKLENEQTTFLFKCQRDDGIIVYLDGEEVLRDNVPKGEDKFDLFATETISGDGETKVNKYAVRKKLDAGEHVLAISLHNREGGSSDLRIAEISLETATEEELAKLKQAADGVEEPAAEDDLF